ncbi:2TM domain-containing protein [Flavobacterium selenitireducens]|uniref:2TM domain-containing protein n=1 Tax=Flavobacterium selenitireducens TaxID=2722704 RepID=UPI00168A402F|nr:2TM domain-containing protein [Flavobacterium selenitireducens]MBD3582604.1 2TM domain-containing protein [Flavobacterium selenitireducens]
MEDFNKQPLDHMRFERAQKRVKQISGFYRHLAVYVIINAGNLIVKAVNLDPGETFFDFGTFSMAFFWGIGLLVHALSTFGPGLFLGNDWEERKIREILEREKRQDKKWE